MQSPEGESAKEVSPPPERLSSSAARPLGPLQLLVLILSLYVLVALLLESLFPLGEEAKSILHAIDFGVCLVFMTDFFVRFHKAPSKLVFMKWGWIDFLSSIPVLDSFRVGRLVRVVRILRLLRAFRSAKSLIHFMLTTRRTSSFVGVVAVCFILLVFSSIAMLQFENEEGSNIKSATDAFWWAMTTMTTVGYGDRYPVTMEGRIVACVLMVAGVGLFGSFTGYMASLLVQPEIKDESNDIKHLTEEIRRLREKVEGLEDRLAGPPLAAAAPPARQARCPKWLKSGAARRAVRRPQYHHYLHSCFG